MSIRAPFSFYTYHEHIVAMSFLLEVLNEVSILDIVKRSKM
jgi:hypothetical protein